MAGLMPQTLRLDQDEEQPVMPEGATVIIEGDPKGDLPEFDPDGHALSLALDLLAAARVHLLFTLVVAHGRDRLEVAHRFALGRAARTAVDGQAGRQVDARQVGLGRGVLFFFTLFGATLAATNAPALTPTYTGSLLKSMPSSASSRRPRCE